MIICRERKRWQRVPFVNLVGGAIVHGLMAVYFFNYLWSYSFFSSVPRAVVAGYL